MWGNRIIFELQRIFSLRGPFKLAGVVKSGNNNTSQATQEMAQWSTVEKRHMFSSIRSKDRSPSYCWPELILSPLVGSGPHWPSLASSGKSRSLPVSPCHSRSVPEKIIGNNYRSTLSISRSGPSQSSTRGQILTPGWSYRYLGREVYNHGTFNEFPPEHINAMNVFQLPWVLNGR